MEALAVIAPYGRGEQIYAQQEPAEYWYRLVSGAAKKYVEGLSLWLRRPRNVVTACAAECRTYGEHCFEGSLHGRVSSIAH
jgi:hypothetical protein